MLALNLMRDEKLCAMCGKIKPRTEFFTSAPSTRSRDGLQAECKSCGRASRKDYYRKVVSETARCTAGMKLNLIRGQRWCGNCGELKPIENFSMRSAANGYPASECKDCAKIRSNNWYHDNTERSLSSNRINVLRNKVVLKLGSRCANPNCLVPGGCRDLRALQIDHVNNDGAEERKRVGGSTGPKGGQRALPRSKMEAIYTLAFEDNEGRYQLLCANCNVIKEHERRQEKYRQRREARRAAS
jgi:hypothetical protein